MTTQQSGKRKAKQRTEQFGGRGSNGKGKGDGQQSSGHLPQVAHSIQFNVAPINLENLQGDRGGRGPGLG